MNPIVESLFSRKSVRAYTDREIPEEAVRTILTAATQAPTALHSLPLPSNPQREILK